MGIFRRERRAHSLPYRNPALLFGPIADVDVDAGVQWLPDSAFAPPLSAPGSTASPRERTRAPAPTPAPPRRGSASSSSSSVADRFKRRDRRRQQHQASPAEAGSPPALNRKGAGRSSPVPDDVVDITAGAGVDLAASDGHGGFGGNEIRARLGDREESVDPVTPSSPFPTRSRTPSGGVRPRPRRAVPFFGSGEWAAGGFPPHHAEASPLIGDDDAAKCEAVAVEFPVSPLSPTSPGAGGSVGGYWGAEGIGAGLREESPSRARERAARESLMRESGECVTAAAVELVMSVRACYVVWRGGHCAGGRIDH